MAPSKKRLRRLRFKFGFAAGAIRNETSFQKTPHLVDEAINQSIQAGWVDQDLLHAPHMTMVGRLQLNFFEIKRVSPLIWLKSGGPAVCWLQL